MTTAADSLSLGDARKRLYEVLEETETPIVEKYRQTLAIGCAYLGVENGHLKQIPGSDGTGARVSVAAGDISMIAGDTDLDDPGFCRMTIEQEDALAIADAKAEGYAENPGYADHGVACYLATRVSVGGETYGTVCFVSSEPREREFDHEERLFVELLGQILGRQLEREHHADALAKSQSKYATLIDASPDPVFLLDATAETVVEANDAAAALTGYERPALEGMDYDNLWNGGGHDAATMTEWYVENDTARRTHPDGTAIALTCADGTAVPVEVTVSRVTVGERSLLHVLVRDIREERERERRTEAIFDQTHQFTGLLSPDGTLLEANDTAMSVCEEDREEILGRPFPECPWWQTDEATRARLRDAIERAADGEFVRYEVAVATVDGPMMIDFSIRPVTDEDGNVELLIPEGRDISARHERDRQLDVLARVLRHNFRNELSVIRGYADHAVDHGDDGAAEAGQRIRRAADNLFEQVEGYHRTVSLLSDPPDPRPVELTEVVEDAVPAGGDEGQEVSVSTPGSVRVQAVPSIGEAVSELVDNALSHAGPDASVAVRVTETDDGVALTVADDGSGLADQEVKVLTGEQTVSPLDHGTGIGLWKTYWQCELSNAEIDVSADDGTTVRIAFTPA